MGRGPDLTWADFVRAADQMTVPAVVAGVVIAAVVALAVVLERRDRR